MGYGVMDNVQQRNDDAANLARIKGNIERAVKYFQSNTKRFHEFQRNCFKTALISLKYS